MTSALATMAVGTGIAAYAGIKLSEAQLAKTLSSSLTQYLDVDPQDIESQLLATGKIDMANVRVQPQAISGNGVLDGDIDRISFSWTWGMNILNHSNVTITGAKLRLVMDPDAPDMKRGDEAPTESTPSSSSKEEEEEEASDGPGATVQHILDQLSVSIADVQLGIQVQGSDHTVVVEAESLGLWACGREEDNTDNNDNNNNADDDNDDDAPLLQQVVMKMLQVYVSHNHNTERVPILNPVGYMASVIRNSGKRFASPSGLEITGTLPQDEPGIVLHMGRIQTDALVAIRTALSATKPPNPPADETTTTTTTKDHKAPTSAETDQDPADLSVVLPLPSITLVLPNGAAVATSLWRFLYFPKESVCQLEAKGTSIVLGTDGFPLLQLDHASSLLVNLTGKVVALSPTDPSSETTKVAPKVAQLDWQETHTKPVLDGLAQLSELLNPQGVQQKKQQLQKEQSSSSNSVLHPVGTKVADGAKELTPVKPWSLNVNGMIAARFEGDNNNSEKQPQWLEASLTSPYFEMARQSDQIIHKVGLERARIGPTSFGDLMLDMGPTAMQANAVQKSALDTISEFMQRIFGMHHE